MSIGAMSADMRGSNGADDPAGRRDRRVPRWPHLLAAAVLTCAVVASGCATILEQVGGRAPLPLPATSSPCAAAAVESCALPYPSDEFTVADSTTATGIRVEMPNDLIPQSVRDALGPGAGIDDAFGGRDGFSAIGPVIFEVSEPIRSEWLPADGGDVLTVFDTATGERQEIRAHIWNDALFKGRPATVLMAWPVTRWEYGHTYAARLAELPGLLAAPRRPASVAGATGTLGEIRDTLAKLGDPLAWGDVISATRFTVGSRENHVGELRELADIARSRDHPVRNLDVLAPLGYSHGAATITGEVRLSDFRDADGVVSADHQPVEEWAPFMATVPAAPASPAGAPVAVYGHGLLAFKESMVVVASENAARGVATVGIDVPNHGARQQKGGHLLDLMSPATLGRLASMPAQGIVDHVSLVAAITDHLGDVDLSPWRIDGAHGDGVADLDTSVLLYEGTSMGGVLGLAEYALIPEFDAAYLQVPGTGIVDILTHSLLWPVFSPIVPANASAGDSAALIGAATMLLDRGDATHLLDDLRDSGRPLAAQVGIGDSVVPEFSTDRMVRLLDLPRVGPARTAIRASSEVDSLPSDGSGFFEVWPLSSSALTFGFMGHITFTEAEARPFLEGWLDQRLAAAGVVPVP